MAEQLHPNHPDYRRDSEGLGGRRDIDGPGRPGSGQQVMGPIDSLNEQTLAVDLARVEIDQQIATAHRFPRNIDVVERKIHQLALRDEASAARCVYALPRANKPILGPSIGLMRIIANAWGNCRIMAEPTYIDRVAKRVYARGAFLDLESNVTSAVSVGRRISDKDGRIFNDDMIGVTQMAAVSIAFRNAVRAGVTDGLWYPIYEKALFIVRGTEETLPERREKAIKLLANFGVDPAKVFMYLQVKKIEEIKVDHLPTLRGMFTALQEGSVTADEMFDPRKMAGVHFETVENPLGEDDGDAEPGAGQGAGGGGSGGGAVVVDADGVITAGHHRAAAADNLGGAAGGGSQAAQAGQEGASAGGHGRGGSDAKGPQPAAGASPDAPGKEAAADRPKAKPKAKPEPAKPAETKAAADDGEVLPKADPEPEKPAAAAEAVPQTDAEYEAHCAARVATFGSETALMEWWKSKPERQLRNACAVIEDGFLRCKAMVDKRAGELRAGQ